VSTQVGVELREAVPEDAERLAELLDAISIGLYGERDITVEEMRRFLSMPRLEVVVAERDGRIVGCADRQREEHRDRGFLDVRVPAGESEVGKTLLADIERRTAADLDASARLMTFVASVDETTRGVVEAAGYERIRSSFHMQIELGDLAEPAWPDGVEVRPFEEGDAEAVHAATQEAFRDHWEHRDRSFEEWREWHMESPVFDPSLWFVARDGDAVAGASLCRVDWSGKPEHGYVSTLAVRRPWRRRGLATALLLHSFAEMKRRDMTRASLDVDAENLTGAVALYERAGMHEGRRFDCYQKIL